MTSLILTFLFGACVGAVVQFLVRQAEGDSGSPRSVSYWAGSLICGGLLFSLVALEFRLLK